MHRRVALNGGSEQREVPDSNSVMPFRVWKCGFYIAANATNAGGAVAPCTRLHARTSCVRGVFVSERSLPLAELLVGSGTSTVRHQGYMRTMAHASAAVCASFLTPSSRCGGVACR
jgi:hypothetical protein